MLPVKILLNTIRRSLILALRLCPVLTRQLNTAPVHFTVSAFMNFSYLIIILCFDQHSPASLLILGLAPILLPVRICDSSGPHFLTCS